jgi:hypothetical protein
MKVVCPECGYEDEGNFCSNCGASLSQLAATPEQEQIQVPVEVSWLDKCPVCKSGKLLSATKKKLFGLVNEQNVECDSCGAAFTQNDEKYKLSKVSDTSNPTWQEYGNQALMAEEWKTIAYGGLPASRQREVDMESWLTRLRNGEVNFRMDVESPIILKKNEEMILSFPNISLWEPRSVRRGGGAGTSFRVAKGVSFRVGGFQAESHEELRNIDNGPLTLTSKRIVFSGVKRTVSIPLDKVISIEPFRDAIRIRREGKEKAQNFVGINQGIVTFTESDREYQEAFSGPMMMYIIEGLVK